MSLYRYMFARIRSGRPGSSPVEHRNDPVLIGGVGGSGTRAFSKVLRQGGIHLGRTNRDDDAVAFSRFYDRFLDEYLENGGRIAPHRGRAVERGFEAAVREHVCGLPSPQGRWGAKNPRSMLMLPFWHQRYPRLTFIHVVRNGLDMAYSDNRFQPTRFGTSVLGESADPSRPVWAIRYWAEVNRRTARFGESHLDARYIRIRYEDLCLDTERTVARLFGFLGIDDPVRLKAPIDEVRLPPTIGRWRDQPAAELVELVVSAGDALRWLGYWSPELDHVLETPLSGRIPHSMGA